MKNYIINGIIVLSSLQMCLAFANTLTKNKTFFGTINMKEAGKFVINNGQGRVKVIPSESDNVEISALYRGPGESAKLNLTRYSDGLGISIEDPESSNGVDVSSVIGETGFGRAPSLGIAWGTDLTVSVPLSYFAGLIIQTTTADIGIDTLQSKGNPVIKINSGSGNVSLKKVNGTLEVNTISGDISMTHIQGPISLNSGSGDVKAKVISEGPMMVNTASGVVEISKHSGGSLTVLTLAEGANVTVKGHLGSEVFI